MGVFDVLLAAAQESGLLGVFVPFLLVYTLFFGILKKSNIFGNDRAARMISSIISAVAAFYVVFAAPFSQAIISFFGAYFTFTTMFLLGILGGIMLWQLASAGGIGGSENIKKLIFILATVAFVGAVSLLVNISIPQNIPLPVIGFQFTVVDFLVLVSILIFLGLFAFLVMGGEESKNQGSQEAQEQQKQQSG